MSQGLFLLLAGLAVGVVATGCGREPRAATHDARTKAELQTLAQRRVFFGHQSVGVNVMEGLSRLATQNGVPLQIAEVQAKAGVPAATFGHTFVAENGDPRRKLKSFEEAFESGAAAQAELALVKFCYVDFGVDTDAAALFADYQASMARLRARHPDVTFVHVTVPINGLATDLKSRVKRLLGRPSWELAANARRDDFNNLLRQVYQGKEPIFDLARVEAERPDGTLETADFQGRAVPVLRGGYTHDGGHLNAEGQERAARELVSVLAAAPIARTARAENE